MPVLAQCSKIRENIQVMTLRVFVRQGCNFVVPLTYSVIPFWTMYFPPIFRELWLDYSSIIMVKLWNNYRREERTKTIGFCLLIPKPYLDKVNGARAVKGLVVYYVSLDYSDESIEGWIEHTILFLQNVSIKVNIFICLHDVDCRKTQSILSIYAI